jgi:methylenetetrahydrofolate dehydrogenase (NADP+)/methenyltetrahydrofolate cyclohydrolase
LRWRRTLFYPGGPAKTSTEGKPTAASIISGTDIAAKVRDELKPRIAAAKARDGQAPGLAAVLVGDNPASEVYVRNKAKACEEMGLFHETITMSAAATEAEVLAKVRQLNGDPRVNGILVQSPLPAQVRGRLVFETISPAKDVDCFHPFNVGKLALGEETFSPCTPKGVQEMLVRSGHSPEKKHVVVMGRSNIVGKPLVNLLVQKQKGANATVTCVHTGTPDIARHTRAADIVVVAAGRPKALTADMVAEGAVVIDVGINRILDPAAPKGTRLVGDVDFGPVAAKVKAISPVPGGVGPMTIAMLLSNTVRAAEMAAASPDS